MNESQKQVALAIIRCLMVDTARKDNSRACYQIINVQQGEFQLPEPWNGNIDAPIMFLSSNPGYDPNEETVTEHWPLTSDSKWDEEQALNHFENRLTMHFKKKDGSSKPSPDFFSFLRISASQILGYEANPDTDYCSTEIVHCKSNDELGVNCAMMHCANRWLETILNVAGAKVVILVGGTVQWFLNQHYRLNIGYGDVLTKRIGNRDLMFASIYHNNARFKGVGEKRESALASISSPIRKHIGKH